VRRAVREGSEGGSGGGARGGWGTGGRGGGECDEIDSQGGSIVEGSEEVLMISGGGCGEEEEVN
jgi:hypothetical protein